MFFDQCALCAQSTDLQASHIIPSFVFNWLKETSPTGYIRSSQNPNLRVQDGIKPPMLCQECYQRFSSWEKEFYENCFTPLNCGDDSTVSYGPWMIKFATSISWRVLRIYATKGLLTGCSDHIIMCSNQALSKWSQFFRDDAPHPGRHEQHMLLVGFVDYTSISNTPFNINRYFARTIDFYVEFFQIAGFTYAKMGKLILFGFIEVAKPRRWKGTKLHVRKGSFGQGEMELPSCY